MGSTHSTKHKDEDDGKDRVYDTRKIYYDEDGNIRYGKPH